MSSANDPTPAGAPQPTAPGADAVQATPPPPAATAIQTAPPAEPPLVPLPPRPRAEPITVEELGRAMTRLDRMIAFLVLVLACFVALFPVRNSDFWLHLATARDWLAGAFSLGEDPYSYTGKGTWVNHSWLYDLLVYGLYQLPRVGGPAVVIAKAVVVVALAALLLSVRRRGQSLWIPGLCTALAVVAMSPRLLLQPTILSYALLGVTVAVLLRRELREEPPADDRKRRTPPPVPWLGEPADRPLWLLPPLFALWVNLDAWFVVGPFALALYLAGQLAQGLFSSDKPGAPRPGAWRPLAAVLVVGLAACLLNPFGARAFTLPAEIGATDVLDRLRQDEGLNRVFTSPLQREYFSRADLGLNIAGMAYYPLVALGVISFALNWSRWRWGRFILWAGFLVLSISHARAIPFFAVVAGPVAALNFQEYAARRFGTAPITVGWWKEWSLLGRALSVLAAFALVLLAWPGWLFGFSQEGRRVGVAAEPPGSMTKLAAQIDEWRRDGTLTEEDRLLNLQPELANGLAWLCPGQRLKWFFDFRFDNYPAEVADEYAKLRRTFDPPADRSGKAKGLAEEVNVWRPILDKWKVSCVVVYDASASQFQLRRTRCAQDAQHLVPLYMDGHAAVYAVRAKPAEPESNDYLKWLEEHGYRLPPLWPPGDLGRFKGKEFDPWSLAFGPKAEATKLPPGRPRPPQPLAWWMRFASGPGVRAPESSDAATYLSYADDTAFRTHFERVMRPRAELTFLQLFCLGGIHTGNGVADATTFGVGFGAALSQAPAIQVDQFGPVLLAEPAPLILTVRSARRAIQRNPDDAAAYYCLGQAYMELSRRTEEGTAGVGLPLLAQMRAAQATAALSRAVLLDPDLGPAHFSLSVMFRRAGFLDLEVKHLMAWARWQRRSGPHPGETQEQFNTRIKALDDANEKMDKQVKDNQNKYEVQSDKKPVLQKSQIALRLGLGEKALRVLLDSDSLEFGAPGARLQLDLLVSLGELEKLRDIMVAQVPDDLNSAMAVYGVGTYERYRALLAAAEGGYEEADEFLEKLRTKELTDAGQLQRFRSDRLGLEGTTPGPAKDLDIPQLLSVGIARTILAQVPADGVLPFQVVRRMERDLLLSQLLGMVPPLHQAAGYEALRGILKLEAGDVSGAQQNFRQALFADKDKKGTPADVVLDFPGAQMAYRYLHLTEEKE
jgi:tetratricopeptide (TPR) repeat protein